MAVDDFMDSEVAVAAAAAAVLLAPPVRALVRGGVVRGLAGVLAAGDLLGSARSVITHGFEFMAARGSHGLEDITEQLHETDAVRQ